MHKTERSRNSLTDPAGIGMRWGFTPLKICNCPRCLTHTECAKIAMETFFCVTGRRFIGLSEDRGCLCPVCPVAFLLGLTRDFFSLRGSDAEKRFLRLQKAQDIK